MLALTSVAAAQTATLYYEGDGVTLEAGEGQVIRGETNLEPGSTVRVTVSSENPQSPFLTRPEAEVDEDGRFRVFVDLSHVEPGSNLSIAVDHDGEELTAETTTVRECAGGCKPVATIDGEGETVTLQAGPGQEIAGETSLDAGASVTVRVESDSAERPFLVAKETIVRDGGTYSTHLDVSDVQPGTPIRVAVLHDGEQLKEVAGEVVACDGGCEAIGTDTPTPRPTADGREFDFRSVVEVSTAGTARIPVSLGDADAATLRIGSEDVNYVTAATVRDGNGDGSVIVEFDASAAGTDERTFSVVDGADELEVTESEPDLGSSIDSTEYDMELYEGESTAGEPDSVGVLIVLQSTETRSVPVSLEKGVLQAQRGETVAIPITLGEGDDATIAIGSDDVDYELTASLSDGDGDGSVGLALRTNATGTDQATLVATSDGDEVRIADPEPSLDGPLPSTDYTVELFRGRQATGDPTSVGTLSVFAEGERPGATQTAVLDDSRETDRGVDLGGLGALAAGAVFAVVGVGLLLGLFRS